MVYAQNVVMTTAQVQEVAVEIPAILATLPVITTTPITHGLVVIITNTVLTAENILVREQATVTPIPHGVAVLGMNTAMIAVHI